MAVADLQSQERQGRHMTFRAKLMGAAFAVLALFSTPAAADWPIDKMDKQVEGTNVIIGDHGDGFCSGTIIPGKHRLILTAEHCVADIFTTRTEKKVDPDTGEVHEVEIEEQQGFLDIWQNKYLDYNVVGQNHFAAKVLKRDAKIDTAILQVIDPDWAPKEASPLAPADWKLSRGQTIYVVGNPAGFLDASITKGIISNTQRKMKIGSYFTPYFQIDAAVIGGNSGGAVYNENGQMIGVVSAGLRTSTINFAVPIQEVRNLLLLAGFPEYGGKVITTTTPNAGPGYPYGGPRKAFNIVKDINGWFLDEAVVHKDR